jgi:hypothetical protein
MLGGKNENMAIVTNILLFLASGLFSIVFFTLPFHGGTFDPSSPASTGLSASESSKPREFGHARSALHQLT